jgi:hypothetical protein
MKQTIGERNYGFLAAMALIDFSEASLSLMGNFLFELFSSTKCGHPSCRDF